MAQFKCPADYVPLQQVTADNLNAHVNNATAQPGLINEQNPLTVSLESSDTVLVYDNSTGLLLKSDANKFTSSGFPVTTNAITGVAGSDVVITPATGQKVDINGNLEVNNLNTTGNATIAGDLAVTGNISGNINTSGNFTNSGTVNFTGTLQVGGSVAYVLYEVYEETLPSWQAAVPGVQSAVVTTALFTKPADEVWIFEIDGTWSMVRGYGASYAFRYSTEAFQTGSYLKLDFDYSSGVTWVTSRSIYHTWTVPAGTALTSRRVVTDVSAGNGSQLNMFRNTSLATDIITSGSLPVSKFRISKYKTA
jgi:hypothetical protein